jgi:hypothetical protein
MYEATIKIQYKSKWEDSGNLFEDMLPEENITFEVPAQDLNSIQLFSLFNKFLLAIGHNQTGIDKGALSLVFNEMRTPEEMRKAAEKFDAKLAEDCRDEICKLEAEVLDLKAKLSRAQNPDNPQYTDAEMDAMCENAVKEYKDKELLNKLQSAYQVCHKCGSKYGNYSVSCSSSWQDECDVCGKNDAVTEVRDYEYLKKGIVELSK